LNPSRHYRIQKNRNATHIFRKTGSFTFKADNLCSQLRTEIAAFFQNKFITLTGAKIIKITKGTVFLFDQTSKTVFIADEPVFF